MAVAGVVFVSSAFAAIIQPEPASKVHAKKLIFAQDYIAVTANPLASKAAAKILEEGGNAIDAAIAAQMVLNVVEPQSSGIGGGGFLLYYDAKTKRVHSFDGRETAPEKMNPDVFLDENTMPLPFLEAVQGGMSVGVPGLLRMLGDVHKLYGEKSWDVLFEPAIALSEEGFLLSERLHAVASSVPYLAVFPEAKAMFLDEGNEVKKVGSLIQNPTLAKTFRAIADNGADFFYERDFAGKIVEAIHNAPKNLGVMAVNDIVTYQAKEREPLCVPYRHYKICGMGMPSSGGATIGLIMGVLSQFPVNEMAPYSEEAIHLIVEAMKLAYADRNYYMADSDFVEVPVGKLLSAEYLKKRAALINTDKVMEKATPGQVTDIAYGLSENQEQPSTTHLSIVDKEGNAVALTSSIEHAFGSAVMVEGFLLNNQLTDFSFIPEKEGELVANRIEPGKRPRSSMAPTIVLGENDELVMVIGSPGGSRIIPYVVMRLIAVLDWQMDIQQAINFPHVVNRNGVTEIEATPSPVAKVLEESLKRKGHKVEVHPLNSGLHAIVRKNDHWLGAADPRREGVAIGN